MEDRAVIELHNKDLELERRFNSMDSSFNDIKLQLVRIEADQRRELEKLEDISKILASYGQRLSEQHDRIKDLENCEASTKSFIKSSIENKENQISFAFDLMIKIIIFLAAGYFGIKEFGG